MNSYQFQAYDLFKRRFNEEEALIVIAYFESAVEEKINHKKDVFLTKDDKVELVQSIANVETKLTAVMKNDKRDILRTIYFVGLGQFLAIVGAVLAIVHFALK